METKLLNLTDILRLLKKKKSVEKVSLEYLFFKMLNVLTEAVDV